MVESKRCNVCGELKEINKDNFQFRKDRQEFVPTCRICLNLRAKNYRKLKISNDDYKKFHWTIKETPEDMENVRLLLSYLGYDINDNIPEILEKKYLWQPKNFNNTFQEEY